MIKNMLILVFFIFQNTYCTLQNESPDTILGKWMSEKKDITIEIIKFKYKTRLLSTFFRYWVSTFFLVPFFLFFFTKNNDILKFVVKKKKMFF